VLAAAVIVTVSDVVGFWGVCDVVSEMVLLVVVVLFVWLIVVGCTGDTVNDLDPSVGSVDVPRKLLARAKYP
jgi:choline-glycine betaine transporter